MNQAAETLAKTSEHKDPRQNQPCDPTAAHGRAITAATARQAAAAGLAIRAEGRWPESAHDETPPPMPGFIVSNFSPLAAATAARCLSRRAPDGPASVMASASATALPANATPAPVTAILIATSRGDRHSADHVARVVADNGFLGPLLFFQSVPNAVAGHIAARWNLTGPVVCLADAASALEAAAQLIEDRDADEALLLRVEQSPDGRDEAHAVLLGAQITPTPGALP